MSTVHLPQVYLKIGISGSRVIAAACSADMYNNYLNIWDRYLLLYSYLSYIT